MSIPNLQKRQRKESPLKQSNHKKQIQSTLNELHRLQAQIYQLNIPENPHSSAPVKKQIKQLSYLYENMTKPKQKNKLNVTSQDIKKTLKIVNGIKQQPYEGHLKLAPYAFISQEEEEQKVSTKKLSKVMKKMYQNEFDVALVSEKKDPKAQIITEHELYDFINFNDFGNFDPVKQAYQQLSDENGVFSFKKFKQISQILGLPEINSEQTLKDTLNIDKNGKINFEDFEKIVK